MPEFLLVDRKADVAVVTLNRPERLDAWHAPMRTELNVLLEDLDEDDTVGAIVPHWRGRSCLLGRPGSRRNRAVRRGERGRMDG